VRGRHEQRQVVQAVVVDAPEERTGDFSDRGKAHDAEGLSTHDEREARECGEQDRDRERTEPELLRIVRVSIDGQKRGEVRR
jgi:hypothetical protein